MALIVPIPSDLTDSLLMADWLELVAVVADDNNASTGDLGEIVRRAGTFEGKSPTPDEAIDSYCLSVFTVLERRAKVLNGFYPFTLKPGVVKYDGSLDHKFVPYLFCLCLAYFGDAYKTKSLKPRLMFEEISALAASAYIGGELMLFGTSRSKLGDQTKQFKAAVTALCEFVGEGKGFRQQPGLSKKDDHVDIVVVKQFADRGTSKLVIFGQCASGEGWRTKVAEMQPNAFWGQWIENSKVSEILRSFFIPFPIAPNEWEYQARYAGLLFDRLRIAYWAPQNTEFAGKVATFVAWINGCIDKLKVA
jgi:hypothetical protein